MKHSFFCILLNSKQKIEFSGLCIFSQLLSFSLKLAGEYEYENCYLFKKLLWQGLPNLANTHNTNFIFYLLLLNLILQNSVMLLITDLTYYARSF